MKLDLAKLKYLLISLLNDKLSAFEEAELVLLSRAIIESYLKTIRGSLIYLFTLHSDSIRDLAIDCISEAFARDQFNKFTKLEKFAKSLNQSLDDIPTTELFLAYKSFLTRISDIRIARMFGQIDPAGAKIHRNILSCAKKSSLFVIEKDYRGLVLKPETDCLEEFEEFPYELLETELLNRLDSQLTIPKILTVFHNIVTQQNKFRRSVPVTVLVRVVKKIYTNNFETIQDVEIYDEYDLTDLDLENIRSEVEFVIKEKIFFTYLAKGKVNRIEAEAMFNAISDIFDDWCHCETAEFSVIEYLKKYIKINEKIYENNYRSKMEYLLRVAREEFKARLMKDL